MIIPHVLQQHRARDDLAGVLHQIFQQPIFARLKRDLLAVAGQFVAQAIQLQIADAQGCCRSDAAAFAPGEDFDAGEQFGKGVWLGEVIVAPCPQSFYPIIHLSQCRNDQRRRLDILLAQAADQRQAVHLGQHAINDQHVVAALAGARITFEPVANAFRKMASLTKRLREITGSFLIVFDNENAHPRHIAILRGKRRPVWGNRPAGPHAPFSRGWPAAPQSAWNRPCVRA